MFKNDLCESMKKEKVSCKELAEYLGVTEHTVSTWRRGTAFPKKKALNDICDLFKLPKDSYSNERRITAHKGANIDFIFDGEKLRALRNQKGWTQNELGGCVDVSGKAIGNWEAGFSAPTLLNLRAICGVFGVREDYFKKREKPAVKSPANNVREAVELVEVDPTPSLEELLKELDNRIDALDSLVTQYCKNVEELKKHVDEISIFDVERDTRLSDLEDNVVVLDSDLRNIKQQINLKSDSNQALSDALKALSSVILKGDK